MKNNLFALFTVSVLAVVLSSCSDDDKKTGSDIYVENEKELSQEIFADDTSIQGGITFVTTGAWTSSVSDITSTRSEAAVVADWISINPASGDKASTYKIDIELQPNYSGAPRKARITVYCNDDKIEITINQVATKENGAKPLKTVKQINISERTNNSVKELKKVLNFRYNDDGRIEKYTVVEPESSEGEFTFTYPSDSEVVILANKYGSSIWHFRDGQRYSFDRNKDGYVVRMLDTMEDDLYQFVYEDSYIKTINNDWDDKAGGENGTLVQYNWNKGTGNMRSTWSYYHDYKVDYEDYLDENLNNIMNIDVNALLYDPLRIGYSEFPAEVLQLFDLLGKRSRNYYRADNSDGIYSYPSAENEDYEWRLTITPEPNSYTFDRDGYVLSLEAKTTQVSKKIEKSTGNVLETHTNLHTRLYEFIY